MQTAPSMVAYLAEDNFELVDKLAPSPEVVYSEFELIGALKTAPVRRNAAKMRPISIVLRGFLCGATVAHPWRKSLRQCARLVSFM